MTRPITTYEKNSLRAWGDWSEWKLAIQTPQTVFTCRVNQTFSSLDGVVQFAYDTATGSIANVFEGMTAFISGSSFGAYEKGFVRVRKAPISGTLYIAATSDVEFADNDYVTIVDLMPLYPRDLQISGGIAHMDYDIAFGTEPLNAPMPVLGPIAAVLTLETDALDAWIPQDFTPIDPSDSYSPDGTAISSFLFACPGAASTSGLSTTTPMFTVNAPGQYLWSCRVTDAIGRSRIGYRWLLVNPPSPIFTVSEPSGDLSSACFSFVVECYEDSAIADVIERGMVVLYERSYYDQTAESLGPIAGYENIKCIGWIEDETIERDPEAGVVRFRVQGPAYWLQQIRSSPFVLQDTTSDPANWNELDELTIDKALAHLLTWYTTASQIMDCILTGDSKRVQDVSAANDNLWEQIASISQRLYATPVCNQFGQLYVQVDPQYLSSADRDALPVVLDVTSADIVSGSLSIEYRTVGRQSFIELSGIGPYDGMLASPLHSRAPGSTPKIYGRLDSPTDYIFDDQADCNYKAGCMLAVANMPYQVSFTLAQNNNFISICPQQYLTISIPATDTPRGIALVDVRLIPRSVLWRRGRDVGEVNTVVVCDVEAIGVDGVTYYPPQPPQTNLMDGFGGFGFSDFPALDVSFPALVPPPLDLGSCISDTPNGPFTLNWNKRVLYGSGSAAERVAEAYFPCTIRPNSFINDSQLVPNLSFYNDASTNTVLTAIKDGVDVLTLALAGGNISGVSAVPIDGFRVTLAAGTVGDGQHMLQDGAPSFTIGTVHQTTAALSHPGSVSVTGLTVGNWYAMRSNGAFVGASAWYMDGIGLMGPGGPGHVGPISWDGRTYWDTRIPVSYSSVDQIGGVHYHDYKIYFKALKTSYVLTAGWSFFGAQDFEVRNATIAQPRQVNLGAGRISNVCPL